MRTFFQNRVKKRAQLGNLRTLRLIPETLIDFASNDYLGLAKSKKFFRKTVSEMEKLKSVGSGGSRLLTGNSSYIEELESSIANFHGTEAGLLFPSGYMANLGLISCVVEKGAIFYDAEVHASTKEGLKLSQAKTIPFRHQDLNHLENKLKKEQSMPKIICVESVYSTDGSKTNLKAFYDLAEKYRAHLIIDEAHAVGIFGDHGKGLTFENQLQDKVLAQVVPFGKALGTAGAIILGSLELKQYLLNFASAFIYTTAPCLGQLAAIKASYEIFPTLDKNRKQLFQLMAHVNNVTTPIHIIHIKGNQLAREFSNRLSKDGFNVNILLSPTVRRQHEVLRISLHSFNKETDLVSLLQKIKQYKQDYGF